MKTITASFHISKNCNIRHNTDNKYRATLTQENGYNIDPTRTHMNQVKTIDNTIDLKQDNTTILKQALHTLELDKLLKEEIDNYNAKQKRKDRHMTYNDLFKPSNKQHIQLYEKIIQFGNSKTYKQFTQEELNHFYKQAFQKVVNADPYFIPICMAWHLDEGTPHMHISGFYMNYNPNRKQGIKYDFSINQVHEGKKGLKEFYYENMNILNDIAQERGYEIQNPGLKLKHIDPTIKNRILFLEAENKRLTKELQQEREKERTPGSGRW